MLSDAEKRLADESNWHIREKAIIIWVWRHTTHPSQDPSAAELDAIEQEVQDYALYGDGAKNETDPAR